MRPPPIFVLVLATCLSVVASTAVAAPYLAVTGVYEEDFGFSGNTPDTYSIANDLASDEAILSIRITLVTSAGDAYFDPAESPFVVLGTDNVGFDGSFNMIGNQTLVLNFSEFDPGETFVFGVDTDDTNTGNGRRGELTTGRDFAGSVLETTWISTIVSGSYEANNVFKATAQLILTPEPGTFGSVCFGLIALSSMSRIRSARPRN